MTNESTGSGALVLELKDVHASIGSSHILQGVTFAARENAVTAILGRNGAGKTTTIKAILGLVKREGKIDFLGESIVGEQTHKIVQRGIGFVPEDRDVFHGLSVEENLRIAERVKGHGRYDLVYDVFPELRTRAKQQAGTLSGGQQRMLSLGRGLLNENALLLIDEPTKGLAPRVLTEVVEVLERVKAAATIVMVEQNLMAAKRLADDVVVMAAGRVVLTGTADELLTEDDRIRSLLTVTAGKMRGHE